MTASRAPAGRSRWTPVSSGFSVPEISGAKNVLDWDVPVTEEDGYQKGEIVTYFCRIHPSMRGAFEVAE